jgi:hypothetical protein
VCGVALLLLGAAGNEEGFFWCLAIFISLANVYMVYLWCGKKMPFPYLVAVTLFAFVLDLLLSPAIVAMNKAMPALIGPGSSRRPVKAFAAPFYSARNAFPVARPASANTASASARRDHAGGGLGDGFAFLETMFFYVRSTGT